MALIKAIASIIGAALSRQLTDEFKAWIPWVVERLLQLSVARLPEGQRERFNEEWRSHINDVPGEVGKLLAALGFLSAARKMTLMLTNPGREPVVIADIVKRFFDVAVSTALLIWVGPMFAALALAIKLDGAGPALVAEERVGLNGRKFQLYKFRTMQPQTRSGLEKTSWSLSRVGRFLRVTALEDIPQLWCVLRGDMAIVGPRPERPHFAEKLSKIIPRYSERMKVKPGITGWAAVNFMYCMSEEAARVQLAYDLYYVENRCFKLDFLVLCRTVQTALFKTRIRNFFG